MKRTFALLLVPALTLTGCVKPDNPGTQDSHHCQQIIRQMHDAPHRYKSVGGNKHLATVQAKLQKDYRHYNCDRYEQGGKLK